MSIKNNVLYLSEQTKKEINEVAALSGYTVTVVREVLEYLLVNWAIKIADHPDDFAPLIIPYIGILNVKWKEDKIIPTGEVKTEVEYDIDLQDSFKYLIGDLHDEGYTELIPMMTKKIEQAIMLASTSTD